MKRYLTAFLSDQSGATAIEYGLLVALLSLAILAITITLGDQIAAAFTELSDQFTANGVVAT
jgi:pilus assembly protein Flp/PilA